MRSITHVVTFASIVFASCAHVVAQGNRQAKFAVSGETVALYEPGRFKGVNYRLMKPIDFDPSKRYPLILSLHGAAGRGTKNVKNLRGWNEWLADEKLRRKYPCFVLAPQSPGFWFDPTSEYGILPDPETFKVEDLPAAMREMGRRFLENAVKMDKQPDEARFRNGVLGKVLELIDTKLSSQYKIDADRVYCLGHSMGGMGTFVAVYQHPSRFAAAIPSAGAFYPWLDATRIKDVPLWIFHGSDDNVVNYIGSRHPFDRLKKLGANAKLTTVTGVGHSPQLSFTYAGDDAEKGYVTEYASDRADKTGHVWDWLFRQKRSAKAARSGIDQELARVNERFKHVDVELIEWPDELHRRLGKLKRIAFMASPVNRPAGKLPLLIALHGGGGKTMSVEKQLARSAEVKGLGLAEHAARDLILLEPNSADDWDPDTLNTMLDYVLENDDTIDRSRIYVMGHSMGGVGSWNWILDSPDRFAAAAPCGFPCDDSGDVSRLAELPIWGMVGGDDGPRTQGVKDMTNRLRKAGNMNVKYTEFAGANHSAANAAVFHSVELVDWMLGFSKEN